MRLKALLLLFPNYMHLLLMYPVRFEYLGGMLNPME